MEDFSVRHFVAACKFIVTGRDHLPPVGERHLHRMSQCRGLFKINLGGTFNLSACRVERKPDAFDELIKFRKIAKSLKLIKKTVK